jgi:hypothetical protein
MEQRRRVTKMTDSTRRHGSRSPVHVRRVTEHIDPLHFPESRQITCWIADGTGRSQEAVPLLAVTFVASALVTGALSALVGVVRLVDFLLEP